MSEYYLGQIMMTGFGFAPRQFAQCNGQLMALQQNSALFALLGVTYGGDGIRTFALPNLASRTPAGGGFSSSDSAWQPTPYQLGLVAGTETVSLLSTQIPSHIHTVTMTTAEAADFSPTAGYMLAKTPAGSELYGPLATPVALAPQALSPAGSNAPHPNIQPYQAINFNIATTGIFPSRN